MRSVLIGAAVLALAACGGEADKGSDRAPTKAASQSSEGQTDDATAEVALRLEGGGLTVGTEKLLFNAGRTEADAALSALLGDATGTAENDECGAGKIESTDYVGGLTVNYMEGQLVGWFWREPVDGDAPAKVPMAATGDVKLGTPKSTVEAMSGYSLIPDSTLGEEFSLSGSFAGFFEEGSVSMLYAGVQCFFR
ncbi:MAG: aspartate-semialdehyde dehydrogenase [Erythrobacter sp.]